MSVTAHHTNHQITLSHHFFFNDTATTHIYTLSLHDALPIFCTLVEEREEYILPVKLIRTRGLIRYLLCISKITGGRFDGEGRDRKSTRLNSSHVEISYAVFCLKKKKKHVKK